MFVKKGHTYIGGASVPFFVTDSMLVDGGRSKGFDQIQIFERDGFPLAKLPTIPPGTDDDWDTIAIGTRVGPDEDVTLPSAVRWVVDVTPATAPPPVPGPSLPGSMPPDVIQAGPPPSWIDVPSLPPARPGVNMPLAIGLGVIGGLFVASWGLSHAKDMLMEGISDRERKNILKGVGAVLVAAGGAWLFDLDKKWWWTVGGVFQKAQDEAAKQGVVP